MEKIDLIENIVMITIIAIVLIIPGLIWWVKIIIICVSAFIFGVVKNEIRTKNEKKNG